MGLTITPPELEPVTVDEMRDHLRIDSTDEDGLIAGMISAAREACEVYTHRQFMQTTLVYTADYFCRKIELPRPPLVSVQAVKYLDTDGTLQTLATSQYRVITDSLIGFIQPAFGVSWPAVYSVSNAVTVEYTAGYGDAIEDVPNKIRQAIKLMAADLFERRESRIGAIGGGVFRVDDNPTAELLLWSARVMEAV